MHMNARRPSWPVRTVTWPVSRPSIAIVIVKMVVVDLMFGFAERHAQLEKRHQELHEQHTSWQRTQNKSMMVWVWWLFVAVTMCLDYLLQYAGHCQHGN